MLWKSNLYSARPGAGVYAFARIISAEFGKLTALVDQSLRINNLSGTSRNTYILEFGRTHVPATLLAGFIHKIIVCRMKNKEYHVNSPLSSFALSQSIFRALRFPISLGIDPAQGTVKRMKQAKRVK